MILLTLAFFAGIVTALSPCVLPVIPLFAGATVTSPGRQIRWLFLGFALAFLGTTVVLASALAALGVTTATARTVAAVVLLVAGAAIAVPSLAAFAARAASPLAGGAARWLPVSSPSDPASGILLGALIGLLWAPCVGPIMAAVIASSVAAGPTWDAVAVALAYVGGTVSTLGLIVLTGRQVLVRIQPRVREQLRRSIGVAMVATAALFVTGLDGSLQERLAAASVAGDTGGLGATSAAGLGASSDDAISGLPADLHDLGPAPELRGITEWINSSPITLASLRGKVVLVHFWTFGCINCIHVQPEVKAWYDRYADQGFVVVAVHTPELSFERDPSNVRAAVADADVRYPVALDTGYGTWRAYQNQYWPAFYFIDRAGQIRHTHFGEGDYDGSEAVIQALLAEPG